MANRYWVRGTPNTWDTTNTANWSATSGGPTGASVPTATDSVFFDQAATYTVTCTGALTCNDITVSAGTVTFAQGTNPSFAISGSMSLLAGTVWSSSGTITFNATTTGKTVTTNGTTLQTSSLVFNGVGGAWTLGSALNIGNAAITVANGTFDTSSSGNYSVTANSLSSSNSNTRTINLNASTFTLSGNPITFTTSTNLTFNAGTSQINSTSIIPTFNGGGKTFYNVSFTSTALSNPSITGANTFNNLTLTGRTTVGIGTLSISANQTINGTLTLNAGTASAYRTMLASDTIGTQRTLTCAAISGGTDYDFRDINIAGAASPISPTRAGDCKGNNGITFPAAKTVYYRQTGTNSWGTTGLGSWSATSGGSADATMFPLAQDTAIFPAATYPASGSTTTLNDNYNIGTIDMSLRTSNTMQLSMPASGSPSIYGNWINGTGITLASSGTITFAGRTTQTITSAGKGFTQTITFNSPSGTVQLQDAFLTGTSITTTLTAGTLDLQSYTLSTGQFNSNNTNTRTIAFGTGNITCTGTGTVWTTSTVTNLTTTGTQVVNVTSVGSTSINVISGPLSETNSISYNFTGGTYVLTFLGTSNNSARNVDFTGYAGTLGATSTATVYGNIKFSTGMTLTASTGALTFGATSGTQQITTNGKTIDFPLTFNGVGGTFQLQDALTMGSTRIASLSGGTLDLNGKTFTAGSNFVVSGTSTRNLTFNGGTVICPGTTSTAFNCTSATNLTTTAGTGTGTISMTGATAKGFNNTSGVNIVFNCTINQGGAGQLTFTGSNTFNNITNTVQPATILFTAGTTTTFTSGFSLSGTAGNLITIGSVTAASHTLSKASGTVSVSYCSISYSTATGGATWEAFTTNGNVNGGNNSGWNFGNYVYDVYISETSSAVDTIDVGFVYYPDAQESVSGLDQIGTTQVFLSNISETVSAADSESVAASIFNAPLTETVSAADSESVAASIFNAPFTDTVSSLDQIDVRQVFVSNISETVTASEILTNAGSTYNAPFTDTVTASDLVDSQPIYYSYISDTTTATDTYSATAIFNSLIYEGVTYFSESTYGIATGTSFSGSTFWSTASLSRVQVNANGPGTGTSGFNAGGNYIAFGTGTFGNIRLYSNTTDLTNAIAITFDYINGNGSNGGVAPGNTLQVGAYDAGGLTAILGTIPISGQSSFGTVSFAIDSVSRVVNGSFRILGISSSGGPNYGIRNVTITYNTGVGATETVSASQLFATDIVETVAASEILTNEGSIYNAPFVDSVSVEDVITNAGSIYNAPFTDTITTTDYIVGAFLWNLIDDSQGVTWANVQTDTPVTWNLVDDSAPTTWQNINTLD